MDNLENNRGDDARGDEARVDESRGDDARVDDARGDDARGDDARGDDARGVDARGDHHANANGHLVVNLPEVCMQMLCSCKYSPSPKTIDNFDKKHMTTMYYCITDCVQMFETRLPSNY